MNEKLLQFIWQFQYFNHSELQTIAGEQVNIIHPGTWNTHQGPDFFNARITIGHTSWAGHIELHLHTSHWQQHGHHLDGHYNNVVLHVVWQHDQPLQQPAIPILELQHRISNQLLNRYQQWMQNQAFIPCGHAISTINSLTWQSWLDRLLAERLLRKSAIVNKYLQQAGNNWEEVFWWMLARNFGIKINADAFEAIARSIPVKILARHKNSIHQLEALLLGQAGLLHAAFTEHYPKMLQKEYLFLQSKYKLAKVHVPVLFLRMRPVNFPSLRLAQLAMLVHQSNHLFSKIKEADGIHDIRNYFQIVPNDYWLTHYRLNEPAGFKTKPLGKSMINNLVINTIAPVLFAYGNYSQQQCFNDKAISWLQAVDAEKHAITAGFLQLGISMSNAADSQALLELKNEYCNVKRCLECSVGNVLIRE